MLSRSSRNTALSEIRDIAGRPVIYRGDVYAVSHSGVFSATDLRTGERRWSLPISGLTTPLPAGDVVFVVSKAGELMAAARDSGQVYWISDLNQRPDAPGGRHAGAHAGERVARRVPRRILRVEEPAERVGARSRRARVVHPDLRLGHQTRHLARQDPRARRRRRDTQSRCVCGRELDHAARQRGRAELQLERRVGPVVAIHAHARRRAGEIEAFVVLARDARRCPARARRRPTRARRTRAARGRGSPRAACSCPCSSTPSCRRGRRRGPARYKSDTGAASRARGRAASRSRAAS